MTISGGGLFAKKAIESAPSINMRQGMRLGRFAPAVGIGYEVYKDWETLPLFTGVSYDFVRRSGHALYAQIDAGYARAWERRRDEITNEDVEAGGYFYHPSIGYRAGKGRVQIDISAGYKIQNISYDASSLWWAGWPQRVTFTQQTERLSFLIGIVLR